MKIMEDTHEELILYMWSTIASAVVVTILFLATRFYIWYQNVKNDVFIHDTIFWWMYAIYTRSWLGKLVHRVELAYNRVPHSHYRISWTKNTIIVTIPALKDNYMYLLVDRITGCIAAVDVCDADKVIACLHQLSKIVAQISRTEGVTSPQQLILQSILITHYHLDHTGGIDDLVAWAQKNLRAVNQIESAELELFRVETLEIVASSKSLVTCVNYPVNSGDILALGSLFLYPIDAPCHTKDHILWYVTPNSSTDSILQPIDPDTVHGTPPTQNDKKGCFVFDTKRMESAGVLFSGDCIFRSGCGKFFEGTAEEMHRNLYTVIGTNDEYKGKNALTSGSLSILPLPTNCLLFPGHEYTLDNLNFLYKLQPSNPSVFQKIEEIRQMRTSGIPSVPSSLMLERQLNPFVQVHIHETAEAIDRLAVQKGKYASPLSSTQEYINTTLLLRQLKDQQDKLR